MTPEPTPLQLLRSCYGYTTFRPMQEDIIRHVLQRRDTLVLMPTGGGKSICFQIPALIMPGTAVVISPLISLMKDQVEALRANGVRAEAMNSGNDEHVNQAIRRQCENGEIQLLYLSPERLMSDLQWLRDRVKVSMFAIDEAHCISQWGHDFRPEYTQLHQLHEFFADVPVMALTATADKLTKNDIIEQLHLREPRIFISSFDRPNLSLDVRRGYSAADKMRTIIDVARRHVNESGIVYCLSRKTTESVARKLCEKGFSAATYHAGLTSSERDRVQEDFINDRLQIVVATIAFGMGIDKSNVRFVLHYNLPKSIESYYQEIGRAGRDGLSAETILFYNLQDIITLRQFADGSGQKSINHERLNRMQEYAEAQVCRRRILLNYFGETSDCQCGNCDVCHTPPQRFDGTIIVQKALSAVLRADEQVGFTHTIDILRGSFTPEVTLHHWNELKTFGAGRDIPARDWRDYLLQMLQMGFIEIAYNEDRHIKVTSLGRDILFGRSTATLAKVVHEDIHVKPKRKERQPKATPQPVLFSGTMKEEDPALFERLREVRRQIADEHGWPAYIVLSDRSLHDLATQRPTTIAEFGNCFGIGDHKRDAFGRQFVEAIQTFTR